MRYKHRRDLDFGEKNQRKISHKINDTFFGGKTHTHPLCIYKKNAYEKEKRITFCFFFIKIDKI